MSGEREGKVLPSVKVVLVGDVQSGKTAIGDVFHRNKFPSEYKSTIGVDFFAKEITVESTPVKTHIWDTSGQERFRSITSAYYRGVHAIGIVLDGTKPVRKQIDRWVQNMRDYNVDAPICFVVNKTDDPKYLGDDACQRAIKEWKEANPDSKNQDAESNPTEDIPVLFCSAKNNEGINEAFQTMAEVGLSHLKRAKPELFRPEKPKVSLQGGGSPGGGSPSPGGGSPSLLEGLIEALKEHRWWAGGNGLLIAAVIVLLILTAVFTPVGAALAVGGLSGLAMGGIIGGCALMLWNALCAIGNGISKSPPSGGGAGGSHVQDNSEGGRNSLHVDLSSGKAQEQVPTSTASESLRVTHTPTSEAPQGETPYSGPKPLGQ